MRGRDESRHWAVRMANEYSQGPDYWATKARKQGYPARSVYKLEEIDERFGLIRRGMSILDLGAAPGSWSLYALRALKGTGSVTAVDLKALSLPELSRAANFLAIQGDLLEEEMVTRLRERAPYKLIMSDAAPDTTGNRTVDTGRSAAIVRRVIDLADLLLAPGGCLVVKLFQGGEERDILAEVRERFQSARNFKPKASRKISFETYCIGVDFHASAAPA